MPGRILKTLLLLQDRAQLEGKIKRSGRGGKLKKSGCFHWKTWEPIPW